MQFSLTSSPKRIRNKLAAAAATFALLAGRDAVVQRHQRLSQPNRPEQCRATGGATR